MSLNSTNKPVVLHQYGQSDIVVPRKQTLFLGLPAELRNAIYEYLIPDDHVEGYWFRDKGGPPDRRPVRHDKEPCCPAILRINWQIHDEIIGMFYGTALFGMRVVGSQCYFLGLKFSAEDLHNATANKLPPCLRFVRSLCITIKMAWYINPRALVNLDSALPPLPLPSPGTTLIAECLSKGPYELRQVTLLEFAPFKRLMPEVIFCAVEDRGKLFRAVSKQYLLPLGILRGVVFNFDNLVRIGGEGRSRGNVIRDSIRTREEVLVALTRLERIRRRFLQKTVERVSQHASQELSRRMPLHQ